MDFRCSVSIPDCPKGYISPGSKTSCPNEADEGFLQRQTLVIDENELLMSRPATIIIFEGNLPSCRRFEFPVMRVVVLLPQAE
jgi:hypothetical protein